MRLYMSSHRLGTAAGELVALLDGRHRIAVIANAADDIDPEQRQVRVERELSDLRGIGLDPVELDLREYFGDANRLRSELARFDAVWVIGGNPFVLRTAFHRSGADDAVAERLRDDSLVFAGYSAGPCVLGPALPSWDDLLDRDLPGYPDRLMTDGMGIVPFVLAPHYGRERGTAGATWVVDDFIENHVPFIALRDGQAVVIEGDDCRVVE